VTQPEAHPARTEYMVDRALSDGRWVVDSASPAPTAERAEAEAAWFMDDPRYGGTYRTVRRTITSTVVAVHPGTQQQGELA
jgi:hypothetical protein